MAWFIHRLHKRRRRTPAPPAPVPSAPLITNIWCQPGYTDPEWFDILFEISFDHATFPVATLEVWFARGEGAEYTLLDTVLSTATEYRHAQAAQEEIPLFYKRRYVNGPTLGPVSVPVQITPAIQLPP